MGYLHARLGIPMRTLVLFLGVLASGFQVVHGQGYNSVQITEIMADPTPVVGLPDAEYIELRNVTTQPISLKGWRLQIGSGSAILPDSLVPAGSYLIVCSRNTSGLLAGLGRVIGLTSFSLANAGAVLTLRNSKGQLVYSVAYQDTWWPSDKRAGGYALEQVDSANPCGETSNWKVSTAAIGGTPGKPNSVTARNPDLIPPSAVRIELAGTSQVDVYFDERLDSLASVQSGMFELKGRTFRKVSVETPSYRLLSLLLDTPLLAGQQYALTLKNVADCAGNLLREVSFPVGVPVKADSGDVILSEILYDPRVGGVEFAEIHNRTQNYISLKNWAIGVVKDGQPTGFKIVTPNPVLLAPNAYVALSSHSALLAEQYPSDLPRTLLEMASMPGFTNQTGGVALRDPEGKVFDLFEYQDSFHSPFLTETKGVSLERMFPEKGGNDPQNWHSAAALVGYATPGYANSQGVRGASSGGFTVEPEAFTPDGDGVDEHVTIGFESSAAGQVASIRIFDVQGRLVRNLVQNQTIGTDGSVRWDGTDQQGVLVRSGYYLLLIDTFDSLGNSQQYRKRVVLVVP